MTFKGLIRTTGKQNNKRFDSPKRVRDVSENGFVLLKKFVRRGNHKRMMVGALVERSLKNVVGDKKVRWEGEKEVRDERQRELKRKAGLGGAIMLDPNRIRR